ncbi:hypothetical protein [Streptomyces sp. NPDC008125]
MKASGENRAVDGVDLVLAGAALVLLFASAFSWVWTMSGCCCAPRSRK